MSPLAVALCPTHLTPLVRSARNVITCPHCPRDVRYVISVSQACQLSIFDEGGAA